MSFSVQTRRAEGVAVVALRGEFNTAESYVAVREQAKQLLAEEKILLLDLGGIAAMDSGGLGTLADVLVSAQKRGAGVKLVNVTERTMELLQLTRLAPLFEIYASEAEALASFRASG